MLIKLLLKVLLITSFGIGSIAYAAESSNSPSIELRHCDVRIVADEITKHKGGTTYAGNVKILIGVANLRLSKVTLVKAKNGSCRLVAAK